MTKQEAASRSELILVLGGAVVLMAAIVGGGFWIATAGQVEVGASCKDPDLSCERGAVCIPQGDDAICRLSCESDEACSNGESCRAVTVYTQSYSSHYSIGVCAP